MTIQRTKSSILSSRKGLAVLSLSALVFSSSTTYALDRQSPGKESLLTLALPDLAVERVASDSTASLTDIAEWERRRKSDGEEGVWSPSAGSCASQASSGLNFEDREGVGLIRLFLSQAYADAYTDARADLAVSVLHNSGSDVIDAVSLKSWVPGVKFLQEAALPEARLRAAPLEQRMALYVIGLYSLYAHLIARGAAESGQEGALPLNHVAEHLGQSTDDAPWVFVETKDEVPFVVGVLAKHFSSCFEGASALDCWQAVDALNAEVIANTLKDSASYRDNVVYRLIVDYGIQRLAELKAAVSAALTEAGGDWNSALEVLEVLKLENGWL